MYVTFDTSWVCIQKGEEESCHINSTKYIHSLTQFEFSSLVIKSMIARKRAFSLLPTPVPALSFIFGCAIFCLSNLSSSTRSSYKQEILQEVNISIFFCSFCVYFDFAKLQPWLSAKLPGTMEKNFFKRNNFIHYCVGSYAQA